MKNNHRLEISLRKIPISLCVTLRAQSVNSALRLLRLIPRRVVPLFLSPPRRNAHSYSIQNVTIEIPASAVYS